PRNLRYNRPACSRGSNQLGQTLIANSQLDGSVGILTIFMEGRVNEGAIEEIFLAAKRHGGVEAFANSVLGVPDAKVVAQRQVGVAGLLRNHVVGSGEVSCRRRSSSFQGAAVARVAACGGDESNKTQRECEML